MVLCHFSRTIRASAKRTALHAGSLHDHGNQEDKMAEDDSAVEAVDDREWSPVSDYVFIREVFGSEEQEDYLEEQLEEALEEKAPFIIIESKRIGDETTKWIQMGNFLHKTSVIAGLGCIVTGLTLSKKYNSYISIPVGVLSLSCVSLYGISWQFDPCCKYQIEQDTRVLEGLQIENLTSSPVVVLKCMDDKYRKRLHNFFALLVAGYFSWKFYRWYTV